jgi:hypothetical protein
LRWLSPCNSASREQELQQEKLLLELSKANTERLAELANKEQNLKSLAIHNEAALQQIRQQEESLRGRERELTRKEKEFDGKAAEAKAKMQEEERSLEDARKEVRAAGLRLENAQQAVAEREATAERLLSSIRAKQEAELRAKETARREEEDRQRPEVVSRLNRRKPGLDALQTLVIDLVMRESPRLVRSEVRKDLSQEFNAMSATLAKIEEEDAFARAARLGASRFLASHDLDFHDSYVKISEWERGYLESHQSPEERATKAKESAAEAEAARRQIEELHQKVDALCRQGFDLKEGKRLDEAIAVYTEAIRLDPTSGRAYAGRGWVFIRADKTNEAHADFTKAEQLGLSKAEILAAKDSH